MTSPAGTEPVRVRIIAEGYYPVRPGDQEAYPGCTTTAECVAADFEATQDGTWDMLEMIGCLEVTSGAVEIVPGPLEVPA